MLNAYTPLTVRSGTKCATVGENAFPNILLAQILFEDGSISVSVRPTDYVGPEAINLFCKKS